MIDDDTDDHEIFKMAIDELKEPLTCLFFTDCESAVKHFDNTGATPPGFVFIDINLPRIDGGECLQHLKRLSDFDNPCIIIYSTSIPPEWKPRLERIGVNRFIEKTDSLRALVEKIHELILPG